MLDIYGEVYVQTKLEGIYVTEQFLRKLCILTVARMVLLLLYTFQLNLSVNGSLGLKQCSHWS